MSPDIQQKVQLVTKSIEEGFGVLSDIASEIAPAKNYQSPLDILKERYARGQIAGPVYGTWIFTRGQQLPFAAAGGFLVLISGFLMLASSMKQP